jgi:ABC-type uncharacterized transport system YnjBCD ATPase subunit
MGFVAALLSVFPGVLLVPPSLSFTNHRPLLNHFHGGRVFHALSPSLAESPALQVEDLTCTHDGGDNYQLYEVSYNLPRGAKVALLGRNGAGKSTFLRILAEATCLDARLSTADLGMKFTGKITCPRNVRVAFVEQEPPMLADVTVADALLGMSGDMSTEMKQDKSVYASVRRYRHASENVDLDREFHVYVVALCVSSRVGIGLIHMTLRFVSYSGFVCIGLCRYGCLGWLVGAHQSRRSGVQTPGATLAASNFVKALGWRAETCSSGGGPRTRTRCFVAR